MRDISSLQRASTFESAAEPVSIVTVFVRLEPTVFRRTHLVDRPSAAATARTAAAEARPSTARSRTLTTSAA